MSDEKTLVVAPDLLMRQKIVGGLQALGYPSAGVAKLTRLAAALDDGAPAAVLVEIDSPDIDAAAVIEDLVGDARTGNAPIVGFCSHMRTELMDQVRELGADRVIARGELVRRLGDVMDDLIGPPPT